MIRQFVKRKFLPIILSFSLLSTSFGGAFAVPAAAAPTQAEESVRDGGNSGVLAAIAAVGLIAVLAGGGSSGGGSAPGKETGTGTGTGSGSGSSTGSAAEEQQALTLLNNDRAANGLPALRANAQLSQLARSYAQDMIARGYFSHNNPEGLTPFDRMKQAGISYKYAGENLAVNTGVASAEVAFMNSSGHRANILSPNFSEVGIGVARNASGQVYVVQEFIGR